jgi:hypothetical protein
VDKKVIQIPQVEAKPEAISSVALGILSIVADVAILASHGHTPLYGYDIDSNIVLISVKWGWLFGVIGLILGILGLRSSYKKVAISGLVLSIASMLVNVPQAIWSLSFLQIFPFNLIPYP